MASVRKLKNGYAGMVYLGKDENKKNKYKYLPAVPKEKDALRLALEWEKKYKDIASDSSNMTLDEAITDCITVKSNILSPSTIRGYETIRKNAFKSLMSEKLNQITGRMIQQAINETAKTHSPKTVKNQFGLLSSILHQYRPDFVYSVTLPQLKQYRGHSLSANEITALFEAIEGDRAEIPILLALWLGLRRSEIIGLKWVCVDTENQTLIVQDAKVPDKNHKFVLRGNTKNETSDRILSIPDHINEKLKQADHTSEFVTTLAGDTIRKHLKRALKRAGLPEETRLHDLRHTMASIGLLLNIGDKYMMERGGWSNTQTMKKIYQHTQEGKKNEADKAIDAYFEKLLK